MARRNQAVLDMIEQVRARLVDLEEDVLAFDGDLSHLAEKLDRIDDRIYLLETEIAKRVENAGDSDGEDAPGRADDDDDVEADTDTDDDDGESMNILTPEAKEKLGETVDDMRVIGREAAETFADLNEAFADITSPFRTLSGRGRRR